jgi:hypothetical protein
MKMFLTYAIVCNIRNCSLRWGTIILNISESIARIATIATVCALGTVDELLFCTIFDLTR